MLEQIGRLRILAWEADGELPPFAPRAEVWLDEHDSHAQNFAVLFDGRPIAAARMCVHVRARDLPDLPSLTGYEGLLNPPIAALTRLVVNPAFRGLGLSRQLDEARLTAARKSGCRSAVGVTHLPNRVRQLSDRGFDKLGESRYRTVSFAPSYVFGKELHGVETPQNEDGQRL